MKVKSESAFAPVSNGIGRGRIKGHDSAITPIDISTDRDKSNVR